MNIVVKLAFGLVALAFVALLGLQTLAPRVATAGQAPSTASAPDAEAFSRAPAAELTLPTISADQGETLATMPEPPPIPTNLRSLSGAPAETFGGAQGEDSQGDGGVGSPTFEAGKPMIDPTPTE